MLDPLTIEPQGHSRKEIQVLSLSFCYFFFMLWLFFGGDGVSFHQFFCLYFPSTGISIRCHHTSQGRSFQRTKSEWRMSEGNVWLPTEKSFSFINMITRSCVSFITCSDMSSTCFFHPQNSDPPAFKVPWELGPQVWTPWWLFTFGILSEASVEILVFRSISQSLETHCRVEKSFKKFSDI